MTDRQAATELANSIRGKYIISQALYIAQAVLDKTEPSNAQDMRVMMDHLFPLFPVLARASDEVGGSDNLTKVVKEMKEQYSSVPGHPFKSEGEDVDPDGEPLDPDYADVLKDQELDEKIQDCIEDEEVSNG
jgi:hypothetical protein